MAYVKLVDYQAKDALITGNPAKKVSGTELGAEFDAVATASALTVDLSSTQTLTNKTLTSPILTTPALGTPASGIATNLTGTATALNIGGNAATATTATTATTVSTTVASGAVGTTQAVDDNSTKIATTAFVIGQAAAATPLPTGVAAVGTSTRYARADHVHAGGALTLLGSATASSSASVSFTSLMSSAYDDYIIKILNAVPATDGFQLTMRMSVNNGSSYFTGATDYAHASNGVDTAGTARAAGSGAGASFIAIGSFVGVTGLSNTAAVGGWNGTVEIFKTNTTNQAKNVTINGVAALSGPLLSTQNGVGASAATGLRDAAVNAIQFLMNTGNITSGEFYLYGVRKT